MRPREGGTEGGPTGETGPGREGTGRTGDDTDGSGGRTAVGTAHGVPEGGGASVADANPTARTRAVELLEERIGALRRPPAEPGPPVTAGELASRPRSADEALALYDRVVHASGGNEVGLFYNPNTGEFAVRVGSEFQVSPPRGDGWQAIVHLHPNPENVVVRRMPAPADVMGAVEAAMRTGSHTEYVQSTRPDGSTALSRVEVTLNPHRIVVELPADPPTPGHPGEPARRIEVRTPEEYAREYGADTTHIDPSSPIYEWVRRDLDDFYRRRRADEPHGAGDGRTAVGTISAPRGEGGETVTGPTSREGDGEHPGPVREGGPTGGPATTGRGAARQPTVREGLAGGRADVRTRFAEADAAFAAAGGEGTSPSSTFDAAMATLEQAGMGAEGRAAVEAMFEPGRGQDELSAGRFRRVTDALARIAELVTARPDLAGTVGLDHYEGTLTDLAHELARAYRNGETLDGRPLSNRDAPELVDAMWAVNGAFDTYLERGATDPIDRLLGLLRFRDAVARAGEILRSYGPGFRATQETSAPSATPLIEGVPETTHAVRAEGDITEPLARDLPGVGLEGYMLTPQELAGLPTAPPGLARQLADLLRGYHRAHLVGPGFGAELFEGIMLAPEDVNLHAQNEGVEHFIRSAAAAGVDVHLATQASGRRLRVRLQDGGVEHVDVLSRVEYTITGSVEGGDPVTFTVVIDVGAPPNGSVEVRSTIPENAPGADVLAAFRPPPTP